MDTLEKLKSVTIRLLQDEFSFLQHVQVLVELSPTPGKYVVDVCYALSPPHQHKFEVTHKDTVFSDECLVKIIRSHLQGI